MALSTFYYRAYSGSASRRHRLVDTTRTISESVHCFPSPPEVYVVLVALFDEAGVYTTAKVRDPSVR